MHCCEVKEVFHDGYVSFPVSIALGVATFHPRIPCNDYLEISSLSSFVGLISLIDLKIFFVNSLQFFNFVMYKAMLPSFCSL